MDLVDRRMLERESTRSLQLASQVAPHRAISPVDVGISLSAHPTGGNAATSPVSSDSKGEASNPHSPHVIIDIPPIPLGPGLPNQRIDSPAILGNKNLVRLSAPGSHRKITSRSSSFRSL